MRFGSMWWVGIAGFSLKCLRMFSYGAGCEMNTIEGFEIKREMAQDFQLASKHDSVSSHCSMTLK